MTTILVGNCEENNLFELSDGDAVGEIEFELLVAKTLLCIYPQYHCFPFAGTFTLEESGSHPDIALVAKDLSHWFVVEVELITHSLEGHVLPQLRNFRYGQPQDDCISILSRELDLDKSQIRTFLLTVPRSVAVIVNKRSREWEIALRSLQVQLLTVSAFASRSGVQAVEVEGRLIAQQEHLGFGIYVATDRSLRFHRDVKLPEGEIMIDDFSGTGSLWSVTRDSSYAWITRNRGIPDLPNDNYVQMIKAFGGRISIKRSPS